MSRVSAGRRAGALAALWLVLGAPAAHATALLPDPPPPAPAKAGAPGPPTRRFAWIARLTSHTFALSQPVVGTREYRFGTRARWNGGPVGLLVTGAARGPDGQRWLQVMLPRRPNGSRGWIRADVASVHETPWRVEVSRAERTLTLLRRGRVYRRWRVVIGAPATPTPVGLFAVNERVPQPDPHGFLGTWILHLTAFSDVLDDFGGGPGRIGIHGRGGASLRDPLGSAASHGCLRMANAAVDLLARHAPEGTPIRID